MDPTFFEGEEKVVRRNVTKINYLFYTIIEVYVFSTSNILNLEI